MINQLQRLMKVISPQLILYLETNRILKHVKGSFLIEVMSVKRGGIWFSVARNQGGKIVACSFSDRSRREAERSVRSALPKFAKAANVRRADPSFLMLHEFLRGHGKVANLSSLDLSNVSPFRRDVYKLLCEIPRGRVTTYGAIAQRIGGKRYSRAVGTAVAKNPFPLIVPCHRVVPASGEVGNYGMGGREPSTGTYMKRRLLELEGVKFQNQKVSERSMWVPS